MGILCSYTKDANLSSTNRQLAGSTLRCLTTSKKNSGSGFLFPEEQTWIRRVSHSSTCLCSQQMEENPKSKMQKLLNIPFIQEQNVQDKYLEMFNLSSIISYLQSKICWNYDKLLTSEESMTWNVHLTRWDSLWKHASHSCYVLIHEAILQHLQYRNILLSCNFSGLQT